MSNKEKIVHMGVRKHDAMMLTPKTTLELSAKDLEKGGDWENCKKIMVIYLEDTEEGFDVGWRQCGMKMSECLALLKVAELKVLYQMRLIDEPD